VATYDGLRLYMRESGASHTSGIHCGSLLGMVGFSLAVLLTRVLSQNSQL
jgi:hypothetical protein